MNGTSIIANKTVGTQAAAWHAEGTADFNGDGKADIVSANRSDNTIAVLFGMGGGNFGAPLVKTVGTAPVSVVE